MAQKEKEDQDVSRRVWRDSDIAVIAKIKSIDSLKKLAEIIQASDGAMVAKGDLGAQIPL